MDSIKYEIETLPEAETEQSRKAALAATRRCPLIGLNMCMKECVCYVPPQIVKCNSKYHVFDGYCGNGMFQDRPELNI